MRYRTPKLADIFISYRRKDVRDVGGLKVALKQQKFAVFSDADLDPGDVFPDELRDELQACRIMLVIIGPAWLEPANLGRLRGAEDWVRKELLTVFERGAAVRVIPVLVGGSKLPAEADLPPELAPLLLREHFILDVDDYEGAVAKLSAKLQGWLDETPTDAAARAPYPPFLPFLCDRIVQEDRVADTVTGAPEARSLVFLLHGDKLEAHDGFIDRLVHTRFLERLFHADVTGVERHRLQWSIEQATEGRFDALLRRAIKRAALPDLGASDKDLLRFLTQPIRPTIFFMQVTWSDHLACDRKLIPGLRAAWPTLFGDPPINPPQPMMLWINFSYESDEDARDLHLDWALPRLQPVNDGDIMQWTSRAEVKPYLRNRQDKLLLLHKDPRFSRGDGTLHMLRFSAAVQSILGA